MELMSSLLLCALVGYLPQALGMDILSKFNVFKLSSKELSEHKLPDNKLPEHKQTEKNNLIVDISDGPINEPPKDSQFNLIYINDGCKTSRDCMGDVIKMYRDDINIFITDPEYGVSKEDIIPSRLETKNRQTREITSEKLPKPSKKNKPKKKHNKSVLVSRYSVDGEVYGLKVKENTNESISCRVYNVKKSYNCNTPESEAFLASKGHKENKIISSSTTTTKKPVNYKPSSPSFKKRDTYPAAAENMSLSVEEMCE